MTWVRLTLDTGKLIDVNMDQVVYVAENGPGSVLKTTAPAAATQGGALEVAVQEKPHEVLNKARSEGIELRRP